MAQYDVHGLKGGNDLVVWLQHDLFSDQKTAIVAPLFLAEGDLMATAKINPILVIESRRFILAIQGMAAVPVSELSQSRGSVAEFRDQIVAAIDLLFLGI